MHTAIVQIMGLEYYFKLFFLQFQHNMSTNPGCQSFSQSTVMHVTHDRSSGGQPKVYQASVSSRSGPGGVGPHTFKYLYV